VGKGVEHRKVVGVDIADAADAVPHAVLSDSPVERCAGGGVCCASQHEMKVGALALDDREGADEIEDVFAVSEIPDEEKKRGREGVALANRLKAGEVGAAHERGRKPGRDDHDLVFCFWKTVEDDALRIGRESDDGGGFPDGGRNHEAVVESVAFAAKLRVSENVKIVDRQYDGAGC